jgi:outer membrane protein OmpA-like peptidoglycan-associated protein
MTSVKFLFVIVALLSVCGTAQAQFGKRLGKAIENAAKRTVERKAEQKTEEAVGKAVDKATDPETYKDKEGGESKDGKKPSSQKQSGNDAEGDESAAVQQDAPKGAKAAEMAYAKSDFVPGDEIIFDDDQASEQMGEFPSMWDLLRGNAEIVSMEGQKGIMILDAGQITPLMKTPKNYLTDQFTIEFDYYKRDREHSYAEGNCGNNRLHVYLLDETGKEIFELWYFTQDQDGGSYHWKTTDGESRQGEYTQKTSTEAWHHVAYSFNKRAFKAYLDGNRIVNIPNMAQAKWIRFNAYSCSPNQYFIRNIRIAKGAVPLYDRMMTDGKIITYGITFDVGKSTIKPESMGEINRIAKLMTDNPDLKFSVEGHTDSTGKADANQKLSDERSAAVVVKLVEMGVAKDRLQPAGKGQTSPIADNGTDEGRAKNRRVEFVKI